MTTTLTASYNVSWLEFLKISATITANMKGTNTIKIKLITKLHIYT